MPTGDSEVFFKDYLKQQLLYSDTRWNNMKKKGWTTMTAYAFAWGYIEQGKVPTETDFLSVVAVIEGFTWGDPRTYPQVTQFGSSVTSTPDEPPWHLYRKTMFDSRCATSIDMARRWKTGEATVRKLTQVERTENRKALKQKYCTHFGIMEGEMEPSEHLEDVLHQWKEMNRITHPISLSECTSVEMEWNLRRLRPSKRPRVEVLDRDGDDKMVTFHTQEDAEATTEVQSVHQLHMALTRLGLALELVDLIEYKKIHEWIAKLMSAINRDSMISGTISVRDCIEANDLLFKMMEVETRSEGIRRELSTGIAPLEDAMKRAVGSLRMERALMPRENAGQQKKDKKKDDHPDHQKKSGGGGQPKGSGKSRNQQKKDKLIQKATAGLQKELEELKRNMPRGDRKGGKAEGEGKSAKGPPLPERMRDGKHQAMSIDGRRICFGYNLGTCSEVEPGKQCTKGWHICSIKVCKSTHSANECDKK